MLHDPRAPFVVGIVAILALAAYLAAKHPLPGDLSASHAQVLGLTELRNCKSCHARGGLASGCLECHEEIQAQLEKQNGFHFALLKEKPRDCVSCHPEHHGKDFELTTELSWQGRGPDHFAHAHTVFRLTGAHEPLACEACHSRKLPKPFSLPRHQDLHRKHTFIGLEQACSSCHADVHAGGLSPACETCHSQNTFRPAPLFDHAKFFPLAGVHERVACSRCHVMPEATAASSDATVRELPFDKVRGKTCIECHESPHAATISRDCVSCHAPEEPWTDGRKKLTAEIHATTGFRLDVPHDRVDCAKCHKPELIFRERYPSPGSPNYARSQNACEGCHEDVHKGQFLAKHSRCVDCHEPTRFTPALFGLKDHASTFALLGAHVAVPCLECHKGETIGARIFVGTAKTCKACHVDTHGGQFARDLASGDCTACHAGNAATFAIRPFDHAARAGYELLGAHTKASCNDCHHAADNAPRTYRGTSQECSACHRDVHRGQLRVNTEDHCKRCHVSASKWSTIAFDHNRESRFVLDGSHSKVPCASCHKAITLPDGEKLIQFKLLGTKCEDCHAFTK